MIKSRDLALGVGIALAGGLILYGALIAPAKAQQPEFLCLQTNDPTTGGQRCNPITSANPLPVTGGGGGGGGAVTLPTSPSVANGSGVVPTVGGTAVSGTNPLPVSSGQSSTDGSTTVTTGGTAQNLFSGTTPPDGYLVCNPGTTDDLWVSDSTTAAANGTGAFRVPMNGGCFATPTGAKPIGAVSVFGATTGDKITARYW